MKARLRTFTINIAGKFGGWREKRWPSLEEPGVRLTNRNLQVRKSWKSSLVGKSKKKLKDGSKKIMISGEKGVDKEET